ncbi:bifunctional UDP-sugar hydrolase/5'-nucleotidase periplasmic [Actinobacillus equuli]|nr:bifunctional UDP-sugar hydrolase/5'-nucleotidase periplasmic [Actinobacillus equuli]
MGHIPTYFCKRNQQTYSKELTKPYVMLDKQGLKVAVVGLTTEDTGKLGNPEVTEMLSLKIRLKPLKKR